MSKRRKMNKQKSKKLFTNTAGNNHVHAKNAMGSSGGSMAMRGGIRL